MTVIRPVAGLAALLARVCAQVVDPRPGGQGEHRPDHLAAAEARCRSPGPAEPVDEDQAALDQSLPSRRLLPAGRFGSADRSRVSPGYRGKTPVSAVCAAATTSPVGPIATALAGPRPRRGAAERDEAV
jgi:hypothetical protein